MINNSINYHKQLKYLESVATRFESHKFLSSATVYSYIENIERLRNYLLSSWPERELSSIKILDWGAGKGHISYLLKSNGFSVTSCDLKSQADDSAFGQETPVIREQMITVDALTDVISLPYDSGSFDVIVSFGVLEHVKDDYQSLKEISRVLKSGGIFYFCMLPTYYSWTQRISHIRGDFYHDKLYRKKRVFDLAENANMIVLLIEYEHLFPKNRFQYSLFYDNLDKLLCLTPLKLFSTNFYGMLRNE